MKYFIPTLLCLAVIAFSCEKKTKPVSERVRQAWTVESAEENGTIVYTTGAPGPIRDYSDFLLDLTDVNAAMLRETDFSTFNGQWEVKDDHLLILMNLSPQPTGTGGTIEYTINSVDADKLDLTRKSTNLKTGNTIVRYVLIHP